MWSRIALAMLAGAAAIPLLVSPVYAQDADDSRPDLALVGGTIYVASLTTAPARRLGDVGQTGRIAPGQVADLVVLERDPAEDVRALASVRYTLRAGRLVYQRDAAR